MRMERIQVETVYIGSDTGNETAAAAAAVAGVPAEEGKTRTGLATAGDVEAEQSLGGGNSAHNKPSWAAVVKGAVVEDVLWGGPQGSYARARTLP